MSSDKELKHKPFASLRGAVRAAPAPRPAPAAPVSVAVSVAPIGRIIVREEVDAATSARITRVIGAPAERRSALGGRWRERLGCEVLIEGRDLLVMTEDSEGVTAVLREAGAGEVKLVRREAPVDLSNAGEAGGTRRAAIRRGLRVAIVQKADQESGALTEGVVRDILTSSAEHPRGIKVRLESGEVGRVRRVFAR